jgi:hypothetical protein
MHSKWYTHSLKPLLFLFIQPRKDRQLCLYKDVEWNWNDKYQVTCVLLPRSAFSEIKTRANERGGQFKKPLYYRKKLNRRVRSCALVCVCVCAPIFGCLLCRGHRRRNAAQYFQSITFFSSCSRLSFSNKKKEIWSPPRIIIILFLSLSRKRKNPNVWKWPVWPGRSSSREKKDTTHLCTVGWENQRLSREEEESFCIIYHKKKCFPSL